MASEEDDPTTEFIKTNKLDPAFLVPDFKITTSRPIDSRKVIVDEAAAVREQVAHMETKAKAKGFNPFTEFAEICGNDDCTNKKGLQFCSKCRVIKYCGRDCQRQHWGSGGHKNDCKHAIICSYAAKGKLAKILAYIEAHTKNKFAEGAVDSTEESTVLEDTIFSAVRQAARFGQLNVVQHFVENKPAATICAGATLGGDVTMFVGDSRGHTMLYSAAEAGQLHIVKYLAQRMPLLANCCTKDGSVALHAAVHWGHVSVVSYLVRSCQTDIHHTDPDGRDALEVALSSEETNQATKLEIAKLLVEVGGIQITHLNTRGQGAITCAIHFGFDEIAAYLTSRLKPASLVDTQFKLQGTFLMLACVQGHTVIARHLLSLGADANARDYTGNVPLSQAMRGGWIDIVRLLLSAKADINYRHKSYGHSALLVAVGQCDVALVRLLLEWGADPNLAGLCYTMEGITALSCATKGRHSTNPAIAQLLIKYGAIM